MPAISWNTIATIFTILATNFAGFFYLLDRADGHRDALSEQIETSQNILRDEIKEVIAFQRDSAEILRKEIEGSVEKTKYIVQPQLDGLSMTIKFQDENNKKIAEEVAKIEDEIDKVDKKTEDLAEKAEEKTEKLAEKVGKDLEKLDQKTEKLEQTIETTILPAVKPKD